MHPLMNLEKAELDTKKQHPQFRVGDTLKVFYKTKEGARERIQLLEGLVIECKNQGIRRTFTIRRIAHGVGVERTFPLYSPRVDKLEVIKQGEVRKAKLYDLRDKIGKKAKIKEKKG